MEEILKLNQLMIGWVNYFGIAKAKSNIQHIEKWIRRRLEHVFGNNGNYQELGVRILLNLEWINIRHINIQIQEKATGEFPEKPYPFKTLQINT